MIRVWIETASAVTRAGLESVLRRNAGIEAVEAASAADVILSDELPDPSDGMHISAVLLADQRFSQRHLNHGILSVLPRDAAPDQIIASIYAASAGLAAVPPDAIAALPMTDSGPLAESLTPRETEVLEMLGEGLSNKQIASRLGISDHTAKFHVNSILAKLGAGTRTEAVMRGLRRGLLKV